MIAKKVKSWQYDTGCVLVFCFFSIPCYIFIKGLLVMTKSEFQKKVIELLSKYQLNRRLKEKIIPLFSIIDNLSQEERANVYRVLEEAVIAQKESEHLQGKLKGVVIDFNNQIQDVSKKLSEIKRRLEKLKERNQLFLPNEGGKVNKNKSYTAKDGNIMGYNRQSFPGEKPNFGLKLNKLFSSYITEYGPEYVTMVISDSILYTNNLILRISLKNQDVQIGSSRSIKLYETKDNCSFLITDKPEVVPHGNRKGFYFKFITYEDILNLTNGDFFKVFENRIIDRYKEYVITLPDELKSVGYYEFD
jgi:cell division protein FtsB